MVYCCHLYDVYEHVVVHGSERGKLRMIIVICVATLPSAAVEENVWYFVLICCCHLKNNNNIIRSTILDQCRTAQITTPTL